MGKLNFQHEKRCNGEKGEEEEKGVKRQKQTEKRLRCSAIDHFANCHFKSPTFEEYYFIVLYFRVSFYYITLLGGKAINNGLNKLSRT